MPVEIRVPRMGESLSTATVARWLKQSGDHVEHNEAILELETDKVSVEVTAPSSGRLEKYVSPGAEIEIGGLLGEIRETFEVSDHVTLKRSHQNRPLASETVQSSGKAETQIGRYEAKAGNKREHRVLMSRLRQIVARNLKTTQNTAAILTTFNEIDMSAVSEYCLEAGKWIEERHDNIQLRFMSFFARAVIHTLQKYPILNARVERDEIVYSDVVNLGIAIQSERRRIEPVVRNAGDMSFTELTQHIAAFAKKVKMGILTFDDFSDGTFSIIQSGVFRSFLSTSIPNMTQSGVLAIHSIQDRPIAKNGQVIIRPMMYVALSYDHRIVDGREAVGFLVNIKQLMEDPRRLLLDL